MNTQDHARILYAFLARVTTRDLDAIVIARRVAADAAMHGNNRQQLEAGQLLVTACERAVTGLIQHDRNLIAGVISANSSDIHGIADEDRPGACPTCGEHESHCNCQGQIDKSMGLMDQDWKLPETSKRKPETTIRGNWPFPTNPRS